MRRILIVEDEKNMRRVMEMLLKSQGYTAITAANGREAVEILDRGEKIDLVISDLKMPYMDGKGLLRHLKEKNLDIPFILITAYGTIEEAVQCMKDGAIDFITKPFDQEVILHVVSRYFKVRDLEKENELLRNALPDSKIVFCSDVMRNLMSTVQKLAHVTTPILITGESGTGKEMIAKAIHSYHSERPFVKINCPAIPDSLFESELFGYQKGAFTGATTSFPGRAKAADDGTLFLDEIADLPKQVQPKLLRLLEEKCFEPLGSNKTIRINTRILCATNRNLKDLVGEGDFRKDLFFRINTVTLDIPPLRKRLEDIEPLSDYFLSRFTSELGRKNMKLSNEVLEAFHRYSWPGNVRELRNVIERAVILSSEEMIALADVTDDITASNSHGIEVGSVLETQERRLLMQALRKFDFNTAAAARELGISRYTMRYRMKKYGIGAG